MQKDIQVVVTGGCEYVDVIEQLAIDRKRIVGAEYANVQPHQVLKRYAAYRALVKKGDDFRDGLKPGGHLTTVWE